MNKELLKGSIDFLLLSLIAQKDQYGYELAKIIREKSNEVYEIGEGTLYPALKRLETMKAVESYWGEANEGGRRKYYRITKDGQAQLQNKMKDWQTLSQLVALCNKGVE
ncbi:PadR family transcriptional regulator [Paenibacillus sp. SYP-B3998]|uniref:PadR family transcriptional regulator n=1 Tax=Paenibacillus sp. SYP-B3998 TaxID=2678564 RepID=A0A6G3ZY80_9BACL|nr:helix-turn-helix transcriptional regulator [Paenibacillus sp. SYP-B3998]NEW06531.1 PadR family transcriptional regulator [Paenibacillus sp. SYP-B3998]